MVSENFFILLRVSSDYRLTSSGVFTSLHGYAHYIASPGCETHVGRKACHFLGCAYEQGVDSLNREWQECEGYSFSAKTVAPAFLSMHVCNVSVLLF